MKRLSCDEIAVAHDDGSRNYYCIWRSLTSVGLGSTEADALDDLRAAAHFAVDTIVDFKLG
jgi:hypothetical protein